MANLIIKKEQANLNSRESIQLWQDRIKNHLEWLKGSWNGWDSWKAAYLLDRAIHWGEAKNISEKAQDLNAQINVPLIATHIRNLMPFLFSRNPIFFGSPNTSNPEDAAATLAQVDYLNAVWREHKMSKQARRSVLDAAIIGHGVCKTGWGIEADIPKTADAEKKGSINYLSYISKENPYIRRMNPFLFLFDRNSPDSDLESARWCCELIIQTVQDLIDNDLYDNGIRNRIAEGTVGVMRVSEYSSQYHNDPNEEDLSFLFKAKTTIPKGELSSPDTLCILYKVYDRKYENVFTMVPGYDDKVLRVDKWKDTYSHLENFPFVKVDFEEVPNEPYGIGHARYLADLQHQKNRMRSKMYGFVRMFNPKNWYKGSTPLSPAAKAAFKSDRPGELLELPVDGSIGEIIIPRLSEDMYRVNSLLDQDYSEVSGEDVLSRGGLLPSRTSAEEIRERRRLRGLRLETNVDNTHEFVLTLGQQVMAHAARYATKAKVVKVIGRPGEGFNNISADQLRNDHVDISMQVISKEETSPETKRRELLMLFQTLSNPNVYQMLQQAQVNVNLKYLWKLLLETYGMNEMMDIIPGIQDTLPQIDLMNTASMPGQMPGNIPGADAMSANVPPNSEMQGLEGLFNQPGMFEPPRY